LSTKHSKLSSVESTLQLNNLHNQSFKSSNNLISNNLKSNNLLSSNFLNINFFENSRFWLFKKYFFTNNQNINLTKEVATFNRYFYKNTVVNTPNYKHGTLFNSGLYVNSLYFLSKNTLTPSLSILKTNQFLSSYEEEYILPKSTNLRLNTPLLDIFSGNYINFIYSLTSNPQNINSTKTNYFNITISTNYYYKPNYISNKVKFYNK
jgi:hypothetical protein